MSSRSPLRSLPAAPPGPAATLIGALWPASAVPLAGTARPGRLGTDRALEFARAALLVGLGSLLLALSAKVQVPFRPVPMTLQTLAVLVIGAAYGARLGAAAVAAYLVEGALGLPVFAGPLAGPAVLLGPTGGFLIGFLPAAWLVGHLAERGWDRSLGRVLAAMALGHVVIFAGGLGWLAGAVGPRAAWLAGGAPFVLATALKTALAAAAMQAAWGLVRR